MAAWKHERFALEINSDNFFQQVPFSHVQHRLDLLSCNTRKVIQKDFHRIARAQMVKQTFNRHARTAKDRLTSQPCRVFFHAFSQPAGGGLGIMF